MEPGKIHANRGVARNKRPLQNILYWFSEAAAEGGAERFVLHWAYERDYNQHPVKNFHGTVTLEYIKSRLTPNQWAKFRQGQREFVKQRRVDGKNVPKKEG
jgi:hypothetical protein